MWNNIFVIFVNIHSFNHSAGLTEMIATLWNRVSPSIKNCKWKAKWIKQVILHVFPHICLHLTVFLFLRIELRSLGKIAEGEELTVSYVDFLNLSEERQRLLKTQYFFDCTCEHCKNHIKDDLKLAGREVDGVKVCVIVHVCLYWNERRVYTAQGKKN